ncbi:hypothetical protein DI005_10965 [Prauserella sp. PE36]|uniref:hypothetical protein n=1 Tax=Prauserella sp. PE36 TaxID=1504709 RepID=UPI000DE3A8F9|nr:hypothetical protein [Prauserella sp. PE36]RBM21328.1 hypothetical protein DI005_10965 [Prauserella sp. PE36]
MSGRDVLVGTPSFESWSVPPEEDSIEYGVFSLQSGCLEVGMYEHQEARRAAAEWRARGEVTAYAAELCPEHEAHPREDCALFARFDAIA